MHIKAIQGRKEEYMGEKVSNDSNANDTTPSNELFLSTEIFFSAKLNQKDHFSWTEHTFICVSRYFKPTRVCLLMLLAMVDDTHRKYIRNKWLLYQRKVINYMLSCKRDEWYFTKINLYCSRENNCVCGVHNLLTSARKRVNRCDSHPNKW